MCFDATEWLTVRFELVLCNFVESVWPSAEPQALSALYSDLYGELPIMQAHRLRGLSRPRLG